MAASPVAGMRTQAINELARRQQEDARRASPVEQAIRFLRARGHVIYRMDVEDGPADRWVCDASRNITADQLLEKAASKGFVHG